MATRILGPTGSRRRSRFFVVPILLVACAALFWIGGASAVHDSGVFELDGNATNAAATPGDDWDNVCHQVTGSDCSTTSDTTGATSVDWVAEPNPSASIFTGGGSKDPQDINQWAWKDAGGLPDKDNLLHGFAARYTPSSGPEAGHDLLFFGSDRLDNSGDAQQGFWFFQNSIGTNGGSVGGGTGFTGVHKTGDVLVISDFSNGGTVSTITVYAWDPTCKKTTGSTVGTCGDANLRIKGTSTSANCASSAAGDAFCGLVNSSTITMPWSFTDKSGTPNNGALNGEFFEGGVDLTDLGLGGQCFASVASETRSSTSTTATLKDFILGGFGACGSSITTQESNGSANPSIGTGSVSVSDTAHVTVDGVSTWAGTVQFHLRGPIGAANEVSTDIGGLVNVSNSNPDATSATATVTAAGDYCWSAHFHATSPGGGQVPDADDNGLVDECFTVTPVTPSLATTAGADVLLGNPVTDTAALSGTANQPGTPAINPTTAGLPAGGSITFQLYGPSDTGCGPLVFTSSAVPVSGDGTYGPVSFTPTAVGTYHWVASYTGNAPNTNPTDHNLTCTDSNEDVVVNSVPSTVSTAQRWLPNDSATISAPQGGNLAGHVTFTLYPSTDCTGTPIYGPVDVNVSGASPQTVSTSNTTVLTSSANVSWKISYTSTNPAQRSIPDSCVEKSNLTIDNGQPVSSP